MPQNGNLSPVGPTQHGMLEHLLEAGLKYILWQFHMASPETCIVGEAYGVSSSYLNEYASCAAFSQLFMDAFRNDSADALHEVTRSFMAHSNGKHRDAKAGLKKKRELEWYDAFIRSDDCVLTYLGR